jgi:hypothetical protein
MPSPSNSQEEWFHPLIARAEPRLNRRRLLLMSGAGLAAAAVARPELTLVAAQTPAATPGGAAGLIDDQVTGDEDAIALLRESATRMAELESFKFEIETVSGESSIFQGLSVDMIEGAVRRPNDFTATVTVGLPFGTIDVSAVGIDNAAWVEDPLNNDQWIALEGAEDIVALINPDTLIVSSIGLIKEATIDGSETIDGSDTTRIAGHVDFSETAEQLTSSDVSLPTAISADPIPVLVWIDDDKRVVEIEVSGPILTSESADVVRAIRFFDFDEPVDITKPDM